MKTVAATLYMARRYVSVLTVLCCDYAANVLSCIVIVLCCVSMTATVLLLFYAVTVLCVFYAVTASVRCSML